jgi:hypothetical protein
VCDKFFIITPMLTNVLVNAELLRELTNLCEGSLSFVDDPFFLSHDELRDIIAYITSC